MLESRRTTGFALSLALHVMLFGVAFLNLAGTLKVDMDKPMYTVDLVSLNPSEDPAAGETGEPAPGPPPLAEGQQEEQQAAAAIPPPPKAADKARPEPPVRDDAKAISEKKVDEKKKPEKKPEQKVEEKKPSREELLKEALKDVKQDVASKSKDQSKVKDALKDIRAQQTKDAKKDAVSGELAALRKSTGGNIFTAGGTGPGGAGGGKGAGAGGAGSGLMSVYGDIVKQIIKKNWRFPAMGTETNMAVVLEINIDQTGKITGSRVAQSSGNAGFDNSAMSAVAQTQTLPPPRTRNLDTLRITFNLQELLR